MRLNDKQQELAIEIFKAIVSPDWYKYIAECDRNPYLCDLFVPFDILWQSQYNREILYDLSIAFIKETKYNVKPSFCNKAVYFSLFHSKVNGKVEIKKGIKARFTFLNWLYNSIVFTKLRSKIRKGVFIKDKLYFIENKCLMCKSDTTITLKQYEVIDYDTVVNDLIELSERIDYKTIKKSSK